jgi:hypothetical protein
MRSVQYIVVEVPAQQEAGSPLAARDLLPWADPYIARLVLKHQLQVAREERQARQGIEAAHGRISVAARRFRGGDAGFERNA